MHLKVMRWINYVASKLIAKRKEIEACYIKLLSNYFQQIQKCNNI